MPRPCKWWRNRLLLGFRVRILCWYTTNFDIVWVFNFNVITNVVFHLRNKNIIDIKDNFYTWHRCLYILCNILQSNIINIIFAENGNHFYIYLPGAKICNFFVELWANMRQTDAMSRYNLRNNHTLVMQVMVCHRYTKFEVCRPSCSKSMADFWITTLSGLVTLTFDLRGQHTGQWCGSWHSIHIPNLKFVGLTILKIWLIFRLSINQPDDLDYWPLTSK